jgi:hypothetical protein
MVTKLLVPKGVSAVPLRSLTEDVPAPPPPAKPPKKRTSWVGWGFMLLLVVGFAVLLAPTVIAHTALRHRLINWVAPELPSGTVVGSAQLGWLSPILLNAVVVNDDEGRPLFTAESITSSTNIIELIKNPNNLGDFEIDKPVLNIVVSPHGSNLDPLRERIGKRKGGGSEKAVGVKLKDGVVTVSDDKGTKLAEFQSIKGAWKSDPAADPNYKLALDAQVTHPATSGDISLGGEWHLVQKTGESHGGEFFAKFNAFPLDIVGPLLSDRFHVSVLAGSTDIDVRAKVTPQDAGGLKTELSVVVPKMHFDAVRDGDTQPVKWANRAPMEFQLNGLVDPAKQIARVDVLSLRSEVGNLQVAGSVADWKGDFLCDLRGEANSDLQLLIAHLPVHLQREVQIEGLRISKVSIRGPLNSLTMAPLPEDPNKPPVPGLPPAPEPNAAEKANLELGAEVAWTRAKVFGIDSNNGQMEIATREGRVSVNPIQVPVSGGRFLGRPQLVLGQQPLTVELAAGPVLENVALSQDMCRSWIKYIAPLMADATSVDGKLSLSMTQAVFPLDNPGGGIASGKLIMQEGRVGPGPIADEILKGVSTIVQVSGQTLDPDEAVWMQMPKQEINFVLKDGRVSHDNVEFHVGQVIVRSSGTVGTADKSLDLLVDFHLPEEWMTRGPVLAALGGETLQLKIGGTLDQPRIDNKPFAEFGKRAGVKAAAGLIQQLIERRQQKRGRR